MKIRHAAELGAAGLLAVGTLGLAATPAFAASVDLGLSLSTSTITLDGSGTSAKATITNHGTTKPASADLVFDATKLKVSAAAMAQAAQLCSVQGRVVTCALPPAAVPAPGTSMTFDLPLGALSTAESAGVSGSVTVAVRAKGDTNKANNNRTVKAVVGTPAVKPPAKTNDVPAVDVNPPAPGKPAQPAAATDDDSGSGTGLPVTGPAVIGLVGGGLAAVAVGLVAVFGARRRTVVPRTPGQDRL